MRPLQSESVSRQTTKRSRPLALAWSSIAIVLSLNLQGCGISDDIDSESNRKAMMQEILNALTTFNCTKAVTLSTKLYTSKYSDNKIRMLHASSMGCVSGVSFYRMLDEITINNFSSTSAIFKSLVRMFPSRTFLDSRLQSAWNAQDALQAILNPGAVVSLADLFYATSPNPGSARLTDRTQGANTFLMFIAMAELGIGLNRYGFNASDVPSATGYVKTIPLPWTNEALITADLTGAGCGVASSLYNLIDSISATVGLLPSSISGQMNSIFSLLVTGFDAAAQAECLLSHSASECAAGIVRLRFRGGCSDQPAAAAAAGGVISAINAGWI